MSTPKQELGHEFQQDLTDPNHIVDECQICGKPEADSIHAKCPCCGYPRCGHNHSGSPISPSGLEEAAKLAAIYGMETGHTECGKAIADQIRALKRSGQ